MVFHSKGLIPRYVYQDNSHACCLTGDPAYFHERCSYKSTLQTCKNYCDLDLNCKGYVSWGSRCQVATTSSCKTENDGKKYDVGRHGLLGGECGRNYGGCFIKQPGMQ